MYPKIKHKMTEQRVGNEVLLLDPTKQQLHHLNPTASWILERCEGTRTIDEIVSDFAMCFNLPLAVAQTDVNTMLNQLLDLGLIEYPSK